MPLNPQDIFSSRERWPRHIQQEILYRKTRRGEPGALFVTSYRALMRVIGYCWYKAGTILLRGQTRCYGNLTPSAFRGVGLSAPTIEGFLTRFRDRSGLDRRPRDQVTTEPLLQHYGLRTRWLDLVDSVPHALFFATHELLPSPFPSSKRRLMTYLPALGGEGIIYLVDVGELVPHIAGGGAVAGVFSTDWGGLVCDLRRAKPSTALRPHAQHGWLCRPPESEPNLWNRMLRIYVDIAAARRWLGGAESLDRAALFPGPKWDQMYQSLFRDSLVDFFEEEKAGGLDIGSIAEFDFH